MKTHLLSKIVATLGPASSSYEIIKELITEGVAAFRINFSHGSFSEYDDLLKKVRKASEELNTHIAIIGDLSGPKIRIGQVIEGGIVLMAGDLIEFQEDEILTVDEPGRPVFSTTYSPFIHEVRPGQRVLMDDGNITLECVDRVAGKVKRLVCKVVAGGLVTSKKGVNLPDTELSVPALTTKDQQCIEFAVEKQFDFLALSFVRKHEDVVLLKKRLHELNARTERPDYKRATEADASIVVGTDQNLIPIITKIEKPQALEDLEAILDETDVVMVARGDLGVEMDLAEVTIHQKKIIHRCREKGVPVIVATQMLQSMIEAPVPTRAEVSDVANAILDGADAVMLSGETAVGKYPVETVRMMKRVTEKTNASVRSLAIEYPSPIELRKLKFRSAALANGVKTIVNDMDIKYIVVWTQLGGSAVFLSQYRIPYPILAFASNKKTLNILSLLYGLQPVFMETPGNAIEFLQNTDKYLLKQKLAKSGDALVFVYRVPINQVGSTNQISIHYVGEEITAGTN